MGWREPVARPGACGGGHLDRLGQHLATALAEQDDDTVRTALAQVERGILAHRQALNEL